MGNNKSIQINRMATLRLKANATSVFTKGMNITYRFLIVGDTLRAELTNGNDNKIIIDDRIIKEIRMSKTGLSVDLKFEDSPRWIRRKADTLIMSNCRH